MNISGLSVNDIEKTVEDSTVKDGTLITVDFTDFTDYRGKVGQAILIKYSAEIDRDAVIGSAGNKNSAHVVYSNDPRSTGAGTPDGPTGETPKVEVKTYVTGISIRKLDELKETLAGASFRITGENLNDVVVNVETGQFTETTAGSRTYEGTVNEDGLLEISGLNAGEYSITEVKAPNGYNLLKDPIKINVSWDSVKSTWKFESKYLASEENAEGVFNGDTLSLDVINYKGVELPSTGGIGTTLFYIVGGLMVAGSVFMMILKQQNKA